MGKKIFSFIYLLFINITLFGLSGQMLFNVDSSVINRLNQMYRIAKLPPPSSAGPWTTSELQQMLDYAVMNNKTKSIEFDNLYYSVSKQLLRPANFSLSNNVKIDTSFQYNLEIYAHTNTNDFTQEEDWNYGWVNRAPIIKVPLAISFSDTFCSQVDYLVVQRLLDYKTDPIEKYALPFWTNNNIPNFFFLDLLWPYHACGVVGDEYWRLQLGRDIISWGPGHTGNFMISKHLPFHDNILFSLWSNNFKYTTTIIDFPSPKEMGTGLDTYKMLFAHRVEFTLFSKVRLAINESMMYQSTDFNLKYLNPFTIYHQYYMPSKSNSLISIEMQLNLNNSFSLYGQWCLDELQILGESLSIPTAMGYQIGLEYQKFTKFGDLLLWGEFTYTDPMLYHRNGIDYIVSYRALYPTGGSEYIQNYLGYQYGGDAIVYAFGVNFNYNEKLHTSLSLTNIYKGETSFDSSYPPLNPSATTPTGIAEITNIFTFSGSYIFNSKLEHSDFLIDGSLSFISVKNKNNIQGVAVSDFQFTAAFKYKLH